MLEEVECGWQTTAFHNFHLGWRTEHLGAYQIMHGPLIIQIDWLSALKQQ